MNVAASRRMMEAFEKAGPRRADAHYFELPGRHPLLVGLRLPRRRALPRGWRTSGANPFPERVVYSTFSPRYNKAYWLRIDRIDRGLALARIEGTRKAGVFDVKTDNLTALLAPPRARDRPAGQADRGEGERQVGLPRRAEGRGAELRRREGLLEEDRPLERAGAGAARPRRGRLPRGSLAQYGPHVYVYGTLGDEATTAASKAAAERLADWGPSVRARWRVLADTEVTPELMATPRPRARRHGRHEPGPGGPRRPAPPPGRLGHLRERPEGRGPGGDLPAALPEPRGDAPPRPRLRRRQPRRARALPAAPQPHGPAGASRCSRTTSSSARTARWCSEGYFRDGYTIPAPGDAP